MKWRLRQVTQVRHEQDQDELFRPSRHYFWVSRAKREGKRAQGETGECGQNELAAPSHRTRSVKHLICRLHISHQNSLLNLDTSSLNRPNAIYSHVLCQSRRFHLFPPVLDILPLLLLLLPASDSPRTWQMYSNKIPTTTHSLLHTRAESNQNARPRIRPPLTTANHTQAQTSPHTMRGHGASVGSTPARPCRLSSSASCASCAQASSTR